MDADGQEAKHRRVRKLLRLRVAVAEGNEVAGSLHGSGEADPGVHRGWRDLLHRHGAEIVDPPGQGVAVDLERLRGLGDEEDPTPSSITSTSSCPTWSSVHPAVGFSPFQARKLSASLGLDAEQRKVFAEIVRNLYRLFLEKDCSLVEINPLAITKEGRLLALDTKINFDDDVLYRHPEIRELRDPDEEEPLEVAAKNAAVNYIKLDGNVGCMVNGAGLAMTTMDMIQMAGGEPANFLDVGGGASAEQIEKAFRILTSDPNVKCILVNIFGGILRCDRVSAGLIQAAKNIEMRLPMVVRLQGTNVEEGRRMLQESGLRFTVADGLYEAAEKAVALVGLG